MPDDYAIATNAAEAVLQAEIKHYVPAWAQSKIPADLIHKSAAEIAAAVVDALKVAHPAPPAQPSPGQA